MAGSSQRSGSRANVGVDGQPGRQHVTRRLGHRAQDVERGPGPLGVDVVGRDRRDPAPVVDAGGEQRAKSSERLGGACRCTSGGRTRRATAMAHCRSSGGQGRRPEHGGARLGQEVLDDHLLHVPVAGCEAGDGLQRGELARPVVADADQDAGGEGDGQLAGRLEGGQASRGFLVGRTAVRVEALGGATRASSPGWPRPRAGGQLVGVEGAGVGVGEQPDLVQDEAAHGGEVVDGGGVAVSASQARATG